MWNPEKVQGFNKLGSSQQLFREFLKNFYNAWGLEIREDIKPLRVKCCTNGSGGNYLRFEYIMGQRKEWLHVKGPMIWY